MANELRLQQVVDLMQEPALVWKPIQREDPSDVVDYRVEMCNRSAGDFLGVDDAAGLTVGQLLPEDTAVLLRRLLTQASRSDEPVELVAAAPDPLTDLARTPSVSVRITHVDDFVLCTWLPGWLTGAGAGEQWATAGDGFSTADRLEFADAVDAVADAGVGVFSLNLMSGRLMLSSGLHRIFGEGSDPQTGLESAISGVTQWQALLRRGEPMDVEVRLAPEHGGHRVRVVGRVACAADGLPAVVRGCCQVLES
ncbi:PAS domain-containing protein [Lentzea nigeriaca]|uniref:PAS domain-containing protein n=1 Tax=Lentzea nigeriaca TaxID=1128665 RepID=UPI00195EF993|nr:PAS domain-containing protein [Lentzea nigeriaca]MBM7859169.1 hypothetical protein [Lentzea nigeriaca]